MQTNTILLIFIYIAIAGGVSYFQYFYKNNIEEIKTAFDTFEFRKLMELCSVGNMSINHKVIATFRKDFYKQFLND
jgi:hypothetical protein